MKALKLPTIAVEKPWGRTTLPAPFDTRGDGVRIGEVWFEPPVGSALLAKYLFTSERLSIQVHPDDAQAKERGLAAGKEEWWYVLGAEPGAVLGIGTVHPLDADELAEAARSGAIEELMQWHPVRAGMMIHVRPGTVHAIGAGLSLIEIQQNSDVTYRLYDYGRPRELHLADGSAVARARPFADNELRPGGSSGSCGLLDGAHFSVARVIANDLTPLDRAIGEGLLLALSGQVRVGDVSAQAGECLWVDDVASLSDVASDDTLVAWARP